MAHPVVHFEIAGRDGKKLHEFYGRLFDWKIEADPQGYGMVHTGGDGGIEGGIMQTQGAMPPYLTFYVAVEELQPYLDRAEKLGGKPTVPPTPIPGVGAFAMFTDPEGNMVGLFKPQM